MNSKRLSKCQIERLVSLMEFYIGKSTKKHGNDISKEGSNDLWLAIASELNAMAGASKSPEKWKKTWLDLKNKVKERSRRLQQLSRRAGGTGPSRRFSLIEERVAALMELRIRNDTSNTIKEIYEPEVNLLEGSEVTIKMEYPDVSDQETVSPDHLESEEATEMENSVCGEVSVHHLHATLTPVEAKKEYYEPVPSKEHPVTNTVHRVTTAFETNAAAVDRHAAALERQTAVLESVKDVMKLQAEALAKVAAAFEKYHKL